MWNFFIIITTISVFCLMVQAQIQIPVIPHIKCISPFQMYGECVPSTNCNDLFVELGKYPIQSADFLYEKSLCLSNDDRQTFVCCPYQWMDFPTTLPVTYPRIYSPNCGIPEIPDGKIIGGTKALLGQWPWMVAFGYRTLHVPYNLEWHCGGSLISTRHVLTAAHCVTPEVPDIVRVGDLDLYSAEDGATPIDLNIQIYHIHPHYHEVKKHNDIAVLKLDRDLRFTQLIKPLCLPFPADISTDNHVRTRPWVAGWGMLAEGGSHSSHLMNVQLSVMGFFLCDLKYNSSSPDPDRILCAGKLSGGIDTCHGDSGGPLMIERDGSYYSIGIVSYGHGCARPGYPGVYTRTSAYLEWIESKLI